MMKSFLFTVLFVICMVVLAVGIIWLVNNGAMVYLVIGGGVAVFVFLWWMIWLLYDTT